MAFMPPFEQVQRLTAGTLVVEIYRAIPERGLPVYSMRIGKEITKTNAAGQKETIVAPHIRVYQDRTCITHAKLERPFAADIIELVEQAEAWIIGDMQQNHEYYLAQMRDREERDAERGKQRTRHTGKTARDRDKRRQRASQ